MARLAAHFDRAKLNDLRTVDVEAFARRRRADGLNPVSVNNELGTLRRILNFAREQGYDLPNVKVKLLKEGERRARAWSHDEVARLLRACRVADKLRAREARRQAARRAPRHVEKYGNAVLPTPTILPLILFLVNTGCRKGEALALTWEHIDLEHREIRIWPSEEWQPKNSIQLSWTRTAFDGRRPWFVCPGSRCGRRRCAVLYNADRHFLCRRCYDLVYRTQNEKADGRCLLKAEKLWKRAGCEFGGEGEKKKWMQRKTFDRLMDEAEEAYAGSWRTGKIARLLARTERWKP